MKKITLLLLGVVVFMAVIFSADPLPGEKELLEKAWQLYEQQKYREALESIDKGLAGYGETEKLLAAKFNVLLKLDRVEEALKTAIRREEVSERKTPWHCLDIVSIYLKLKSPDTGKAFEWLDKAVERGFLSYTELDNDEFALLRKDKRFNELVEKIKNNIGIDKPAKDFAIELITGEKFALAEQKGTAILIDFWATWCKPCREGIPHLKEFYLQYKDKGFEIIGISLDSDKAEVEKYIAAENLKWKLAFSGNAWQDATARLYNVNLIPSYWLIDKKGILRDFGMHLRDKETLKKAIEKLITR